MSGTAGVTGTQSSLQVNYTQSTDQFNISIYTVDTPIPIIEGQPSSELYSGEYIGSPANVSEVAQQDMIFRYFYYDNTPSSVTVNNYAAKWRSSPALLSSILGLFFASKYSDIGLTSPQQVTTAIKAMLPLQ